MRTLAASLWCLVVIPATLVAEPVDYRRDIKPILHGRCFACHGALRQKAGLRLDAVQLIRQGGKSGPAIVPGKSAESLLCKLAGKTIRPRVNHPARRDTFQ